MATKKGIVSLPASGGEAGLNRYLAEIKKFPILSPEEEYMLAKRWREHGDTEAAEKLVFNLRRMKNQIDAFEEGDLKPQDVTKIATDLGVTEDEVVSMNRRMAMGGDTSLNVSLKGDEGGESQWQDFLVDTGPLQDELMAEDQESQVRHDLLIAAMESLNDREKHILMERRLADEPKTLEELSQVYGVSRERIRQIEVRAFEKLQAALLRLAGERKLLPAA